MNRTKRCNSCKIEKTVDCFYKNKRAKDGLQHKCKSCVLEYYLNNKDHKKEYDALYRVSNVERSKEYRKEYRAKNGELLKAQSKEYYINNKEKFEQYSKDNKDKKAATSKEYRTKNADKIKQYAHEYRVNNKVRLAEYGKRYRQTEPGINAKRRKNHKRRALKAGVGHEHFDSTHIFERDGYVCQICGVKTKPNLKNVHHHLYPNLDHIIPLSRGGEHSVKNTQCLCRDCNMKKFNKIEQVTTNIFKEGNNASV